MMKNVVLFSQTFLIIKIKKNSLQFVDGTTKQRLIEAYYSLDNVLCREIIGKKLSSRLKKELVSFNKIYKASKI